MKGNCSICGSEKNVRNYQGKQVLCGKHREQMRRFGEIRQRTMADKNEYVEREDHYEMIVFDRKLNYKGRVLISKEDFEMVSPFSWCIDGGGYVMNGKTKLHTLVMGKEEGKEIDHISGDKLDNRRSNLRFVTHGENVANWHRNRRLAEGGTPESFFEKL